MPLGRDIPEPSNVTRGPKGPGTTATILKDPATNSTKGLAWRASKHGHDLSVGHMGRPKRDIIVPGEVTPVTIDTVQ
eukprot:9318992-Karenia_brevis.AAC.1